VHKYEPLNQQNQSPKIGVGIVGARGYSGLELARLLLAHPLTELKACFATDPTTFKLGSEIFSPKAAAVPTLPMTALDESTLSNTFHTIFLATPAEVSLELAPKLVAKGVNVIDLSGAFRLEASEYPKWYGFAHTETAALSSAQYGLVPFAKPFTRDTGKGALIANPGCYVTAVLMGLLPLAKAGVIDLDSLVIDAKSGTTGAGKKASEGLLFSEVDGECLPYKVGKHQHYPEIVKYLSAFSGAKATPFFSTSLLATPRGIIAGMYANLLAGKTEADVAAAFAAAYVGYPLAKVSTLSGTPKIASLKQVVGTNGFQIGYTVDATLGGAPKLYLYSLIDNLRKGAASQAVENLNRLIDRPAALGLTPFLQEN